MPKDLPTPETLRKLLRYEPDTGKLFWRERSAECFKDGNHTALHSCAIWNSRYANTEAFTLNRSTGYKQGHILRVQCSAHRVAWAMYHGFWPKQHIDHINGIRHDNRIKNLRDVSMVQNARNSAKSSRNTSGVCGVSWAKRENKWSAQITLNYKKKHLGFFDDIEAAAVARKAAEIKFGFSERHGKK